MGAFCSRCRRDSSPRNSGFDFQNHITIAPLEVRPMSEYSLQDLDVLSGDTKNNSTDSDTTVHNNRNSPTLSENPQQTSIENENATIENLQQEKSWNISPGEKRKSSFSDGSTSDRSEYTSSASTERPKDDEDSCGAGTVRIMETNKRRSVIALKLNEEKKVMVRL